MDPHCSCTRGPPGYDPRVAGEQACEFVAHKRIHNGSATRPRACRNAAGAIFVAHCRHLCRQVQVCGWKFVATSECMSEGGWRGRWIQCCATVSCIGSASWRRSNGETRGSRVHRSWPPSGHRTWPSNPRGTAHVQVESRHTAGAAGRMDSLWPPYQPQKKASFSIFSRL